MNDLRAENYKLKTMLGRALSALDKIAAVDGLARLSSNDQDIVEYLRQDIAVVIAGPRKVSP